MVAEPIATLPRALLRIPFLLRVTAAATALTAGISMAAFAQAQAQTTPPAKPMVALVGGTVIGIDGEAAIPNAVVLIEGERIKAVGPAASVQIPEGTKQIKVENKFLIPGLMNMHVHFGLKLPGAEGAALASETDPALALRMATNARKSLEAGVTTVRLTGEEHGVDFALKASIERGDMVGPRIQTAGNIIVPTGGHGFLEADGPYGLGKAVRQQIKQGATWIKIAISGGIADTHGAISAAPMTDEELSTILDIAHRNDVKVTAHNGSTEAALQSLKFGIDCFEHGYHLNEAVLKQMKAKGVWLVPTIVVSQAGAMEFFKKIGSPDWYLERAKSTGKDHWAMLQNAIKIGVPIALGTDQFPFEPNGGTTATVREAELYVEAGMTPLQALQAGTIQTAKMLRMEQDVGRIQAGKYADILTVDADPTKDIKALRTIGFVMKGGSVVRDRSVK
jgi:imidazolonepropionase-like amidohydrolase